MRCLGSNRERDMNRNTTYNLNCWQLFQVILSRTNGERHDLSRRYVLLPLPRGDYIVLFSSIDFALIVAVRIHHWPAGTLSSTIDGLDVHVIHDRHIPLVSVFLGSYAPALLRYSVRHPQPYISWRYSLHRGLESHFPSDEPARHVTGTSSRKPSFC